MGRSSSFRCEANLRNDSCNECLERYLPESFVKIRTARSLVSRIYFCTPIATLSQETVS